MISVFIILGLMLCHIVTWICLEHFFGDKISYRLKQFICCDAFLLVGHIYFRSVKGSIGMPGVGSFVESSQMADTFFALLIFSILVTLVLLFKELLKLRHK